MDAESVRARTAHQAARVPIPLRVRPINAETWLLVVHPHLGAWEGVGDTGRELRISAGLAKETLPFKLIAK
jgi:hypothetical protein